MKLFQGEIWVKNGEVVFYFSVIANKLSEAKQMAIEEIAKKYKHTVSKNDIEHQTWKSTKVKKGAVQANMYNRI